MALGREIQATAAGQKAAGEGGSFRLRPGLPPKDVLEYVQQLTTVLLLLIALGIFVYYLAASPKKAVSMALARVGMRP